MSPLEQVALVATIVGMLGSVGAGLVFVARASVRQGMERQAFLDLERRHAALAKEVRHALRRALPAAARDDEGDDE